MVAAAMATTRQPIKANGAYLQKQFFTSFVLEIAVTRRLFFLHCKTITMRDIFISYRRDTGSNVASLVKAKLEAKKIDAFLDRQHIQSEDFTRRIRTQIDQAPNFLMILTPGYFVRRPGEDWVMREIEYAIKKKKNFIALRFNGYDPYEADWEKESDEIRYFKTFNTIPYNDSTAKLEEASINSIIENMVDDKGLKFSLEKGLGNNAWYLNHEMTDEDMLWILSDHDVCKSLDWEVMDRALGESVFADRQSLSMFVFKAYDIDSYALKYSLGPKRKNERSIDNVYGFTYDFFVDYADARFGENHFKADVFSDNLSIKQNRKNIHNAIKQILDDNHIRGFDIIDFTLVIKDHENPEELLSIMSNYLNPEGGVIYIRELDDDFVYAYPDEKNLIGKMKELLELDTGAGNRHTGKKIYTFLKKAGACKVYISNKVISTANMSKRADRERICDTYFSYLRPEMAILAQEDPLNEKYKEALSWLNVNYPKVQSLFRSTEFYFRTGHIAVYGVFKEDEDD